MDVIVPAEQSKNNVVDAFLPGTMMEVLSVGASLYQPSTVRRLLQHYRVNAAALFEHEVAWCIVRDASRGMLDDESLVASYIEDWPNPETRGDLLWWLDEAVRFPSHDERDAELRLGWYMEKRARHWLPYAAKAVANAFAGAGHIAETIDEFNELAAFVGAAA